MSSPLSGGGASPGPLGNVRACNRFAQLAARAKQGRCSPRNRNFLAGSRVPTEPWRTLCDCERAKPTQLNAAVLFEGEYHRSEKPVDYGLRHRARQTDAVSDLFGN